MEIGGEAVEDQISEDQISEDQKIRENGGARGVVISIEDLATSIEESMENQPKQLKATAAHRQCSIFRIPGNLKALNPQAYKPHIVSIGPYHHGKQELSMMEEHKGRFLKAFLGRSEKNNGRRLRDYLEAMAELEDSARACYSEEITTMNSEEFVRMLLLDGCFLVELIGFMERKPDDPIFRIPWLFFFLTRDLLKLENQLPLFVLQRLFDLSHVPNVGKPESSSFPLIAIKFFRYAAIPRPDEAIKWSTQKERSHLLDLYRATFISPQLEQRGKDSNRVKLLHCVTKLSRAGVEFRSMNEANTFLDIKFERGVLMIPHLEIEDFASSFLQNCIAFEQSHPLHNGDYFTAFATFMDCLIDTEKDVSLLVDKKVINNHFGKDEEVANFFNKLGRDVFFNLKNCYLAKEFDEVNGYYATRWNVMWAQFINTYFSSPWSFISVMAALILLILTVTQTAFAIYPYYHPRN